MCSVSFNLFVGRVDPGSGERALAFRSRRRWLRCWCGGRGGEELLAGRLGWLGIALSLGDDVRDASVNMRDAGRIAGEESEGLKAALNDGGMARLVPVAPELLHLRREGQSSVMVPVVLYSHQCHRRIRQGAGDDLPGSLL